MSKHIFWISSYPKSGNTLVRTIITSLFFTDDGIFDFKLLKKIPIIEDTFNLEFVKNIKIDDYNNLHKEEIISKYWLKMQTKENLRLNGDFMFVKTHHALVKVLNNSFTTRENTLGIIYVVRDPRDVVLSMSNHFNFSIEKSIDRLSKQNFGIFWNDIKNLYKNKILPSTLVSSWDNHFLSWNKYVFDCPRLIIKFEDIVYKKKETIKKLVYFFVKNYNLKFSNLEKKIENIIKYSDFNYLKKLEDKIGFDEAVNNSNFFNKGTKNQWLDKLSDAQIYLIEKNYYNLLKQLNYRIKLYNKT